MMAPNLSGYLVSQLMCLVFPTLMYISRANDLKVKAEDI